MRDNQKKIPTLPLGGQLVAAVYGSGTRQHLAVVLALVPTEQGGKYAVWNWNAQTDGCGNGDYVHRSLFATEELWVARAWDIFVERGRYLATESTTLTEAAREA